MKAKLLSLIFSLALSLTAAAQVGIGTDNPAPDPSAMLDIQSLTGGLLLPRMSTADRDAISSPADALVIFNTTSRCFEAYNAIIGVWEQIHCFTCPLPDAAGPVSGPDRVCDNSTGYNFSVPPVPGATGYLWSYSGDGFSITEGDNTPAITASFFNAAPGVITVTAINPCGAGPESTGFPVTIDAGVPSAPLAYNPVLSQSVIGWNWTAVPGAAGYRWSQTNDFETALDLGPVTSYTQVFLSCGTSYTTYIWAYNGCGHSSPVAMTATTYECCGIPIQVTHLTLGGTGAPVNKTVTYETVSYPPGAPDKCWIGRNLGASAQATHCFDDTEAAAGWYYQFNRKQGYKHDGANRTPNSTWINTISENSDWTQENDPCALSFGYNSGWRMPTKPEWETHANGVDIGVAFDGPLKIHAGGYLYAIDGVLLNRGTIGRFWSASQWTPDGYGFYAEFNFIGSMLDYDSKAFGLTVRCIRNF